MVSILYYPLKSTKWPPRAPIDSSSCTLYILEMSNLPVPQQGSLTTYLTEINKFPLLSPKEERDLAVRFRETGDVEAAHKLVTSNLRFVVKIANEYNSSGVRTADLIQEGNIGLMIAVKKFNPDKGPRLISYAVWWIRAMIRSFIQKSWSLVKMGATQAQRRLFGRDASLDQPLREEGPTTHLDLLTSGDNQEELVSRREERDQTRFSVKKALALLNEKEKFIVKKRLMSDEPMTLQEIGDHYHISRERARQLEERAKKKIRDTFCLEPPSPSLSVH